MKQLKADVPFIPDVRLESMAEALLEQAAAKGIAIEFPIPVESIVERVLDIDMDWTDLDDSNAMARLNYSEWKIQPNESLRELFDRVPGTYHYTLAHEIFHAIAHVEDIHPDQQMLDLPVMSGVARRRFTFYSPSRDETRREQQAQRFAAYLLMPKALLLAKIEGLNLCNWAVLRQLAAETGVSLQALKIRLQKLGCLYEAPNGRLYPSKETAHGQLPLL